MIIVVERIFLHYTIDLPWVGGSPFGGFQRVNHPINENPQKKLEKV
jgi:hypothetical protein